MNRSHAETRPNDSRLEARIESYQLAAKMQQHAPEALDLNRESLKTRAKYGLDEPATADFGRRCLLARRLLERGTRFVQVWSAPAGRRTTGTTTPISSANCRPSRGLWINRPRRCFKTCTIAECFRTRWLCSARSSGDSRSRKARWGDHNQGTSVAWLAGAGVKGGVSHGESDPWSWRTEKDRTYSYDLHATILHLMGIDHTLLSVRHDGTDRRLTDVHGHVIEKVLA